MSWQMKQDSKSKEKTGIFEILETIKLKETI